MEIADWLHKLGLGQYARPFAENAVQWDVLPKLTADDLKDIGVVAVGDRRRLLEAITLLGKPPLALAPQSAIEPMHRPSANEAERRQLTVMFCDLVGSTALSGRLDAEDLRDVIGAYHRAVAGEVERFGGFVAKYMGDGVLVYFGYPQAQEDDAERAVRAALALIENITALNTAVPLETRVGVATGLVVVGDLIGEGAARERSVVGETPNLAARLQAIAEPNSLVIGETTRRLIGDFFACRDLGAIELRGFAGPQRAWRVLGESAIISRFEALRSGTTPLIGRAEELGLLEHCWDQAKSGEGRVVLVSGEAGIGKSRLCAELVRRIDTEPHLRLRYSCSPHHQDSALYPFIAQLEHAAEFFREDSLEERRGKLEAVLAPPGGDSGEIELIAELLSLPNAAADLNLSSQRKREKLFESLLGQLAALTQKRPVLMLFEDAHWIDPTSRELMDMTVKLVTGLPLLLVITFRPEFQPTWSGQQHVMTLALNRLAEHEGAALVTHIAGQSAVDPDLVSQIVERTDGVPLFVEELTKAVLESADRSRALAAVSSVSLSIPATLHASLIARLDRLGTGAREVAQVGAVLGRMFDYDLVERVARRPDLDAALGRLAEAGLLFCRGSPPQSSYMFKHALVQDAAYSTLLRNRRRELHSCAAAVLEREFAEVAEAQPALVAHHYTEAGQPREAAEHWGKAGRRSAARSAVVEAAAQLRKGIDQLRLLPEDHLVQQQELELLMALGSVMQASAANASPERGRVYARARELWERLGCPSEFLYVLHGQALYHVYCGEIEVALQIGNDLLRLSREQDDRVGLTLAHHSLGRDLTIAGRFNEARSHLEELQRVYDEKLFRHAVIAPRASSRTYLGFVLFVLGFPDRAIESTNLGIAEAEKLAHRPALAHALAFAVRLFSVYGENAVLTERAEQHSELCRENGFRSWGSEATMYRGWAKVNNGCLEEGITLLLDGAAAYRASGNEAGMSHYISLLARAQARAGRLEEALRLMDDALRIVEATGEGRFLAELYRQKAELLLESGEASLAERLLRKAIGVAREQQAKMWELRAAVSLAQFLIDREKRVEARDLLDPVYSWFTEGFRHPDLKAARMLLQEIG